MCEEVATDARAVMCVRSMLLPEARRISQRRRNVLLRMLLCTRKLGRASWLTWEGKVPERGGKKLLGVTDEIQVLERVTKARIPNPADLRTQEVPGEQTTVAAEASVLENELRGLRGC
jgi:hypothetical protein